jgi:hypothetical protein
MEEDIVKQNLPEIYESIVKTEEDVDFALVKEDLEELVWLKFDELKTEEAIVAVWKVADRWGVSVLQQTPRFKILKLTKVKISITNFMYNISSSPKIKQICQDSQNKIDDMTFFQCAKNLLYASSDEDFSSLMQRIVDTYNEFKSNITSFFIHFDKVLKSEMNCTLSSIMDSVFNTKVLKHFSEKMSSDEKLKKILSEYSEKKGISASSGYTITYTHYPSDHSSWARENIYKGQINEEGKREGFGKINYFGGDSYQGQWKNDRPEGLGLYIWKLGGRYLGNFEKGLPNGEGERIYNSGNYFKGNFLAGKKNGLGVMCFKNGDVYDGMWEDDFMHGEGKYTWATGDVFIGRFVKDIRDGPGCLNLVTHESLPGTWKDNSKNNS